MVSHPTAAVQPADTARRYRSDIAEPHPCGPSPATRRGSVCDQDRIAGYLQLDSAELDTLEAVITRTDVPAGGALFGSDQLASDAFLVLDGTLRVVKSLADGRRIVFAFAGPGDFLGIAAEDRYSYDVDAITNASVCRISRRRLNGLLDQCPRLRNHLLHVARGELHRAQERMLLLGCKTATERLASFLVQFAERCETAGLARNKLYLPMPRGDIADYLGLTTETVCRIFSQMTQDGLIALPGPRHVTLLDRKALIRETGGPLVLRS